jgi:hypothetical protein
VPRHRKLCYRGTLDNSIASPILSAVLTINGISVSFDPSVYGVYNAYHAWRGPGARARSSAHSFQARER